MGVDGPLSRGWASEHLFNHLSYLGHVVKQTPCVLPFIGGQTYLAFLGFFIPRFLWLEKPAIVYANTFGHRDGFLAKDDFQTTQNFDAVTESWMSGGWPAVIWSALGWGMLFGCVMGWFVRGGDQNVRVIVALTLAQQVASFESEAALGGFLHGVIVIGLLYVGCRSGRRFFREFGAWPRARI